MSTAVSTDALATSYRPSDLSLSVGFQRDELLDIARRAALRLAAVQSSSGVFLYEYDASTGKHGKSAFNMVRMAGATYSLCWAAEVFMHEPCGQSLRQAAVEAIGFLLLSCRLQSPQFYVGSYTPSSGFSSDGALGASALLLNALLFPSFYESYRTEAGLLVDLLVESQTPVGAFRASPHRKWSVGQQRYYSGEAILALVRHMQSNGADHLLPLIEKSMEFYREYFRRDPNQALVLWHSDAWSRMIPSADRSMEQTQQTVSTEAYLALVVDMVATILPNQITPENYSSKNLFRVRPEHVGGFSYAGTPGISTSVYVEGIARAYGASVRAGRVELLAGYLKSMTLGVGFLRRLQISDEEAQSLPNPGYSAGGFRQSLESWILRIDNDQHMITACFALLETLPADLA